MLSTIPIVFRVPSLGLVGLPGQMPEIPFSSALTSVRVTAELADMNGVSNVYWEIFDQPYRSAPSGGKVSARIVNPTNTVAVFDLTAGESGTYLVTCRINGVGETRSSGAICVLSKNLAIRFPAAGESVESCPRGWMEAYDKALRLIDGMAVPPPVAEKAGLYSFVCTGSVVSVYGVPYIKLDLNLGLNDSVQREILANLKEGLPIRYQDTAGINDWRYGICDEWAVSYMALNGYYCLRFTGQKTEPFYQIGDTLVLEAADSRAVIIEDIFIPGQFALENCEDLEFRHLRRQRYWSHGDAVLVQVKSNADSGSGDGSPLVGPRFVNRNDTEPDFILGTSEWPSFRSYRRKPMCGPNTTDGRAWVSSYGPDAASEGGSHHVFHPQDPHTFENVLNSSGISRKDQILLDLETEIPDPTYEDLHVKLYFVLKGYEAGPGSFNLPGYYLTVTGLAPNEVFLGVQNGVEGFITSDTYESISFSGGDMREQLCVGDLFFTPTGNALTIRCDCTRDFNGLLATKTYYIGLRYKGVDYRVYSIPSTDFDASAFTPDFFKTYTVGPLTLTFRRTLNCRGWKFNAPESTPRPY